jgi:4-hydroxybenzoate polyprenyltransferase
LEEKNTFKDQQTTLVTEEHTPLSPPVADEQGPVITNQVRFRALLKALRPRQWTKNGAVFIGLVFSQQFFNLHAFERTALAFLTFCLASSIIYLLNDLLDLKQDRLHPVKRLRPLASGLLPKSWAIWAIGVLLLICSGLVVVLCQVPVHSNMYASLGGANVLLPLVIVAYLVLMVFYTTRLKHVVLIDVFVIACGFVLRILAGTVVIPVIISPWLYLVTCFLSLFLAFSKRRHEIVLLQGDASGHRKILKEYSIPLLDQITTIMVVGTLISYSIYTVEGSTGDHRLIITVPFVLYGMLRYLYLVHMRMEGGSPEEVLLRDRHILGSVVLCTILVIAVLYLFP